MNYKDYYEYREKSKMSYRNQMVPINLKRKNKFESNLNPYLDPYADLIFKRVYSRLKDDGTKESWKDTLERVVNGILDIQDHFGYQYISGEDLFAAMAEKKFLPAGRGLWIQGTNFLYEKGAMALNNCAYTTIAYYGIDDPFYDIEQCFGNKEYKREEDICMLPFTFAFDCLMLGVGVGFDISKSLQKACLYPTQGTYKFIIDDLREGWVEAYEALHYAYLTGTEKPIFDYCLIRKKGAPIKGFGGISAGYEPLKHLLDSTDEILSKLKLSTRDYADLINLMGVCVVAGNIRRSAEMLLGEIDDEEFISLKEDNERNVRIGWVSNNTVKLNRNNPRHINILKEKLIPKIKENGEPGLLFIEKFYINSEYRLEKLVGLNPCGEQRLYPFECCNLSEIILPNIHDIVEMNKIAKIAYFYNSMVHFADTHFKISNIITKYSKNIGISVSGITSLINKETYEKDKQEVFFKIIQLKYFLNSLNREYFNLKRLTTIKPSGTISQIVGVSAGASLNHNKYEKRNVRFNKHDLVVEFLKQIYPQENDIYSTENVVLSFPKRNKGITITDIENMNGKLIEIQLKIIEFLQDRYSDNQVSNTIIFNNITDKNISDILKSNIKSITLLPLNHSYQQAPIERITKEEYENMINEIKRKKNDIKLDIIIEEDAAGVKYCDGDYCPII